jgi:glycosyltransferase involved in cell wall biosynthesis
MNAPLRVLLVSEPGIDGVFRHVEALAYFCLQNGVELHLAYSDRRSGESLKALLQAVRDAGGETLNLRVGNAPEPRDVAAIARLLALARRIRPDVIHGHSSKAGALVRALRCLGWSGPLFYTPHAYYGLAPRPSKTMTAIYNGIERLLAHIGTTINTSRDEAFFARRTIGVRQDRLRIIHNPVDTKKFVRADDAAKRQARADLGLPADAVLLGFLGRSSFQKDPQTFYRAAAQALAAHPELRIFHVGQGEFDEDLRVLASDVGITDKIIRRAYLERPAIFFRAIDALILTSRYEGGWPFVILEALASDLPVISGDGPGTRDIAQGGLSHCWTARVEDADGFGRAIQAWIEDRPAARPSNHRQVAIARYGFEKCLGAVVEEYRKALA